MIEARQGYQSDDRLEVAMAQRSRSWDNRVAVDTPGLRFGLWWARQEWAHFERDEQVFLLFMGVIVLICVLGTLLHWPVR